MSTKGMFLRAGLVAFLAAYLVPGLYRLVTVLGFLRTPQSPSFAPGDFVVIEDTVHCEDIHHHLPSNTLFTACEDDLLTRFSWFPPLAIFTDPVLASRAKGSIHVIDPKTLKSKRLRFEGFDGPFSSHGIEVISDPLQKDAVYIYAVNHQPHPEYLNLVKKRSEGGGQDAGTPESTGMDRGQSQIEVFHHELGSDTLKWLRSIQHPLIRTPNDILAQSPSSIYVTNDHYYREGQMRAVEDFYPRARWSDTVHIQIEEMTTGNQGSQAGVSVTVALTGLHNNNGLGHGATADEIAIGCAVSGAMHIAHATEDKKLQVTESVYLDSTIDNPTYFKDQYATDGNDASGFVLGGLARACDISSTHTDREAIDGVLVWLAQRGQGKEWKKKLIFEDDGSRVRTSSAALLVGIDPALEGGKKKAWLFVTGFVSKNMVAAKVDL